MRLVEFLVELLEAQAQSLQRLAALLGEDVLIYLLEQAGDIERPPVETHLTSQFLEPPRPDSSQSPYSELESAVHEMKLPALIEFHLWAYPHYRAFVESGMHLNARIPRSGNDIGLTLVDETIGEAQKWVRQLSIPPEMSEQAERAAQIPWLRFRAEVLKRIGRRPLGPVY